MDKSIFYTIREHLGSPRVFLCVCGGLSFIFLAFYVVFLVLFVFVLCFEFNIVNVCGLFILDRPFNFL